MLQPKGLHSFLYTVVICNILQETFQQRNDKSIIFIFMPHVSGQDAVIVGVLDRLRPIYSHWTVDSLMLCI